MPSYDIRLDHERGLSLERFPRKTRFIERGAKYFLIFIKIFELWKLKIAPIFNLRAIANQSDSGIENLSYRLFQRLNDKPICHFLISTVSFMKFTWSMNVLFVHLISKNITANMEVNKIWYLKWNRHQEVITYFDL